MMHPRSKMVPVLVLVAIVAGIVSAVALSGVLTQTTFSDGGTLHYQFIKRVAFDFDSGWHTHAGLTVIQVQEGSLKIYERGNCTPVTVNAGDTRIEIPYETVRAIGKGNVVWTTSFLIRAEDPLLTPMPASYDPCPGIA
ncbi:MAG: hypothetical protein E6G08_20135 [Actinobacteria bacterium]|nr:MAG: hypothetical protein E6G08_20135 [Actinomycetota bacterium]